MKYIILSCLLVIGIITIFTFVITLHIKKQTHRSAEQEHILMDMEHERMRANLLRAVSHDLRTPLTGIIGSSSTYLDNYDAYSEAEKKNLVRNINHDANTLLNMIENILTVTRIQTEGQKIALSSEVVEEVVSEAVHREKSRYPEFAVEVSIPSEFLMIPVDPMLIEQVLINLLENARIHAKSSFPTQLLVEFDDASVTFRVKDHGVGVSEAILPTLFQSSYGQRSSCDQKPAKGMGIGLTICKTIVAAHGGTIGAKNTYPGAEFYFSLPRTAEETEQGKIS